MHSEYEHSIHTIKEFQNLVRQMKEFWCSFIGYDAITPYFHCLEQHVSSMIKSSTMGSISYFNQSSQEAKHKIETAILFRAPNIIDGFQSNISIIL